MSMRENCLQACSFHFRCNLRRERYLRLKGFLRLPLQGTSRVLLTRHMCCAVM